MEAVASAVSDRVATVAADARADFPSAMKVVSSERMPYLVDLKFPFYEYVPGLQN